MLKNREGERGYTARVRMGKTGKVVTSRKGGSSGCGNEVTIYIVALRGGKGLDREKKKGQSYPNCQPPTKKVSQTERLGGTGIKRKKKKKNSLKKVRRGSTVKEMSFFLGIKSLEPQNSKKGTSAGGPVGKTNT